MTTCNVILHSRSAHILTDGEVSFVDDLRRFCTSKVWVMPHLSAAMVISGPYLIGPVAHWRLSESATTYDELKTKAVDVLRAVEQECSDALRSVPDRRIALTVAGIDGNSKPDSYVVANHDRKETGSGGSAGAWSIVQNGPIGMQPAPQSVRDGVTALFSDGIESYDDVDPVRDGIRMMDLQRQSKDVFGVGRFVQLTTITASGITTRITHRWEDSR